MGIWRGPLRGIPIAFQDLVHTAQVPTEAGSRVLEEWPPPFDATVLRRLRAAGAINLGKTHTHEFAYGVNIHSPDVQSMEPGLVSLRLQRRVSCGGGCALSLCCRRHGRRRFDSPSGGSEWGRDTEAHNRTGRPTWRGSPDCNLRHRRAHPENGGGLRSSVSGMVGHGPLDPISDFKSGLESGAKG